MCVYIYISGKPDLRKMRLVENEEPEERERDRGREKERNRRDEIDVS